MVVIAVMSIIVTIVKKKGWFGNRENEDSPAPPVDRSGQPPTMADQRPPQNSGSWEEELRRLLEGQPPAAPPPQPPRPRPVAAPAPPPVINAPPPVARPVYSPVPTARPVPPPVQSRPHLVPTAAPVVVRVGEPHRELAKMSESKAAYERASQLHTAVTQHIKSIPGQRVQQTRVIRHERSAEITQVMGMFRNPQTTRQAIIASFILGPPRALEQGS